MGISGDNQIGKRRNNSNLIEHIRPTLFHIVNKMDGSENIVSSIELSYGSVQNLIFDLKVHCLTSFILTSKIYQKRRVLETLLFVKLCLQ